MPRYGWGVLCLAGGGAYYFAKRSVNADRATRHEAEMRKHALYNRLEPTNTPSVSTTKKKSKPIAGNFTGDSGIQHKGLDHAGSPSSEASEEEAPVGHAPVTPEQKVRERSKYEAAEVYRSKKGDRFS